MIWSAIPVTVGGFERASAGAAKNVIKDKFYGPNHEEVGGIFERDQVLGAFGAARQQP
ncbi:MAG: transferrin-binding protein-like solute binding protein [Rhodospirillaceae bacterium]|nr:transferrin-binding protein-like solute binding protein [Rhodospirillaceae bacterium]